MTSGKKRILVLGAGLVSEPLVRYLLDKGYQLTVADLDEARANEVVGDHASGRALRLDVMDESAVSALVTEVDLVVSLVPPAFHPRVARHCLEHGKHLIAPSYVSDEMTALDAKARAAGLTFLNEIGLDPGIDHMSAMRIFDSVRARDGRVVSFRSYCGGLPAPDSNDNPFGYKFTWSPRGVLLASRNSAKFKLGGRIVEVPGERLFRQMHLLEVPGAGDFEAYPNRNSLEYIDIYGLEGVETIYRGTLRNIGWCDCMHNFRKLGLLDLDDRIIAGLTFGDFMRELIGTEARNGQELLEATARKLDLSPFSLPIQNLRWLGMFWTGRIDGTSCSPLDVLGQRMHTKLAMQPLDRDMIVLVHTVRSEFADGHRERTISRLVQLGARGGRLGDVDNGRLARRHQRASSADRRDREERRAQTRRSGNIRTSAGRTG